MPLVGFIIRCARITDTTLGVKGLGLIGRSWFGFRVEGLGDSFCQGVHILLVELLCPYPAWLLPKLALMKLNFPRTLFKRVVLGR